MKNLDDEQYAITFSASGVAAIGDGLALRADRYGLDDEPPFKPRLTIMDGEDPENGAIIAEVEFTADEAIAIGEELVAAGHALRDWK